MNRVYLSAALLCFPSLAYAQAAHEELTPFRPLYGTTVQYSATENTGGGEVAIGIGKQVFVENLGPDRCYFRIGKGAIATTVPSTPGGAGQKSATPGGMPAPVGRPIVITDYASTTSLPKNFVAVCPAGDTATFEITTGYGQ